MHAETPTSKPESVWKRKCPSFVAAMVVYLLLAAVTFALPPHCSRVGCFAALKDKHHLLKLAASPKIVFIGGSNLSLGLDSSSIEKQFHKPVVNMGLCSSFGLPYLFEEIKDNIGPGDTIVLVPEYQLIDGITVNGNPDLIRATEVCPYSLTYILRAYSSSSKNVSRLIQLVQGYFIGKWRGFYGVLQVAWQQKQFEPLFIENREAISQTGSPARFCFDKHGDYFGHFNHPNVGYLPTKWLIGGMTKEAAGIINNFNKLMQQRGATLVIIPPPVPREYFVLSGLSSETLSSWTHNLVTASVLADPARYLFPISYFFEAPYHLNFEGRAARTKLIAEDLDRYFRTNSKQMASRAESFQ